MAVAVISMVSRTDAFGASKVALKGTFSVGVEMSSGKHHCVTLWDENVLEHNSK